ncbi:MAG: ribosomal RNA small subunit methyltransferase A [Candidatus Spechtbacteria bacterium RIFCSPLOWO2_01_FULL_46_10]|uniref:Ribosomal RNA small subunit methyltransferase A n=1 Tax=Candidatus Spechtbacteria bacterium RIFCSPLOWO2_01_FULL_46_10 TaxID=1802163 RepID=A0A1G2HG50_9BACT|nr:MAG: ribosomal RNA small subunit methyltransferase A [Candidatus Spechtbacteria bacterium RIFCSPLOWO2_01_FULL_46_10]
MGKISAKELLEKYRIRPNKLLGQNFLINESVAGSLVETAGIGKNDTIVEVGPGTGTITKLLAEHAGRVIAVEKDRRFIPILKEELKALKNIEVVNDDILGFNPARYEIRDMRYKLVGAPPYYLTARLFRHFLQDTPVQPVLIALIIQKEVAQNIIAKPPDMNLLAVSVQLYGESKIEKIIKKGSFWPSPRVNSALITVKNIQKPQNVDEKEFFKIVRAGFASPRKQLTPNLVSGLKISRIDSKNLLESAGIAPSARAETLVVGDWLNLYTKLRSTR